MLSKIFNFWNKKTIKEKIDEYNNIQKSIDSINLDINAIVVLQSDLQKAYNDTKNPFLREELFSKLNTTETEIDLSKLKLKREKLEKSISSMSQEKGFEEVIKINESKNRYYKAKEAFHKGLISSDSYHLFLKSIGVDVVKYSDNLVFNNKGELLIIKRPYTETTFAGLWSVPGGHVDLGEDHLTAAKRELEEETGIQLCVKDVTRKVGEYKDEKVEIEYFETYLQETPLLLLDHKEGDGVRWIDTRELLSDEIIMPMNMKENIIRILGINGDVVSQYDEIEKGHKYIKREGVSGNYSYIYKESENNQSNNFKNELDYAKRIITGEQELKRLSPTEEQGRLFGGKRNVEATIIAGAIKKTDRVSERYSEKERQEDRLKEYSKEEGVWFNKEYFDNLEFVGEGGEARVYFLDEKSVVKINHYPFEEEPIKFLDRISIHNILFPECKYELLGFSEKEMYDEKFFSAVLKQEIIEHEGEPVSQKEVADDLQKRGFEYNEDIESYVSGDYIIGDTHQGNVLRSKDGNLIYIDTMLELNTAEAGYGGSRELGDIIVPKSTDITKSINSFITLYNEKKINKETFEKAIKELSGLVKREKLVTKNGKTFKQNFYYRENEQEKEVDTPIGAELSPSVKGLEIEKYSDKAILIKGDTYANKDLMQQIKKETGFGVWNGKLKGWLFGLSQVDKVLGLIWSDVVDKDEDKAQAIQNQKNASLESGDEISINGEKGKVEENVSNSDGIKYNVSLEDGTKLDSVDEKVIDAEPTKDDSKISKTLSNAVAENRAKTEKKLFGIKPIEDIHNYTLSEYLKMNGVDEASIQSVLKSFEPKEKKETKTTVSYSSGSKSNKDQTEGLTLKQFVGKLISKHRKAVEEAIERGDELKSEVLDLYSDLKTSYNEKRKAMSEETKRKISEALTKDKIEDNSEVSKYKSELNELVLERDENKQLYYDLFKQAREVADYKEAEKVKEKARDKGKIADKLDIKIQNHKNIIQVLENGGSLETVEDKVGVSYSNIPSFTNIDTEDIDFNVDNILTKEKPLYIPEINEEDFKSGSFIFDMIKVNEDKYLLATNKYKEKSTIDHGYTKTNDGEYDPQAGGFVALTLDQLVLTQDYYTTKQKALYKQEAENKNQREIENWNKKEDKIKEYYYNQRNFYESMSVSAKKKVSKEQWNNLTLKEKEEIYIPVKKYNAEKIKSRFDEKHMASSFHSMYERFNDPTALRKDSKGNTLQRGESKGYQSYANENAWKSWQDFRETLDFKINDINIQREEIEGLRSKAIETSYGESNTNDILLNEFGVKVKRQNGEQIKPKEIEQLKNAWVDVQKSFGGLVENAKKDNLKLSHAGKTYMFASTAIGVYVPRMKTIGVTDKLGEDQLGFTMSHEVAHWVDHTIGRSIGKRHASDNYDSTAGKIATIFRKNMNNESKSNYINATHECFARAFEQYHAIEDKGNNAIRGGNKRYIDAPEYVSEKIYNEQIKPLIKQFLDENKEFLKSIGYDIIG